MHSSIGHTTSSGSQALSKLLGGLFVDFPAHNVLLSARQELVTL